MLLEGEKEEEKRIRKEEQGLRIERSEKKNERKKTAEEVK